MFMKDYKRKARKEHRIHNAITIFWGVMAISGWLTVFFLFDKFC